MNRLYLDTSIWLDLFEERNKPNLPKSDWARKLFSKVVKENYTIVVSDVVIKELHGLGYESHDLDKIFKTLEPVILKVDAFEKEKRKSKDLAKRRNIPVLDALHALIARNNKAVMVTLDYHFKELKDIVKTKSPKDFL